MYIRYIKVLLLFILMVGCSDDNVLTNDELHDFSIVITEYFSGNETIEAYIELYNSSLESVDIGGWFFSNSIDDEYKFKVPVGTVIPAQSFIVIKEDGGDISLENSFSLGNGEYSYILSEVKDDTLTGNTSKLETYYTDSPMSFGRFESTSGVYDTFVLSSFSEKSVNSGFALGELIFTEIMYHPKEGMYEYLKIKNRGSEEVRLSKTNFSSEELWSVEGIDIVFPENAIVPAGEEMVLFGGNSENIETFRSVMGYSSSTSIFAYGGKLSNSGECLKILKSEKSIIDENGEEILVYSLSDKVDYMDSSPWATEGDGDGYSLKRVSDTLYGNSYKSWTK